MPTDKLKGNHSLLLINIISTNFTYAFATESQDRLRIVFPELADALADFSSVSQPCSFPVKLVRVVAS